MKKQETLEETAKKYCLINNIPTDQMIVKTDRNCEFETPVTMFIKGAKWQQEQQDNIEKLAKDYEDSVVYADKGVVYHAFIEGYNKARNHIIKPELNDLKK